MAEEIASGMKSWAIELGATHYTHLFQPLTGATAEKHESFVAVKDGRALEQFKGSALVQQEPDASSFPNGGLRNTFEARGYTAWDPNSPVFILDGTLCIPSVFVSYTGEALDMKVPNLRSLQALDGAATAVARLFDPDVVHVQANVGLEQEYFLVDEALFNARPDLQLCGRTVIGHTSAKDQQLSDHYFGAIPSRVAVFMKDFETEAYKLGIPLQTRHNEVAPNQFECAPVFSEITTAIDQNMLLMIVMQKVAQKHHLKVIFHEKPFQGINGSGKHCNWSMQTDTGINLLSPGPAGRARGSAGRDVGVLRLHAGPRVQRHPPKRRSRAGSGTAPQHRPHEFAAGDYSGQHGPQPHLSVCLYRQPLRVPRRGVVGQCRAGHLCAQQRRGREPAGVLVTSTNACKTGRIAGPGHH